MTVVESINLSTGVATGVVKVSGYYVSGLAPDPLTTAIPEPSTRALMFIGFSGLGFAAYRRSRPVASGAETNPLRQDFTAKSSRSRVHGPRGRGRRRPVAAPHPYRYL
jgi:hypothetical protein